MSADADRPLLGIALMLGFCALAPLGDSIAKLLGQSVPLLQLLLIRFAIQAVLLLPLAWRSRGGLRMTPRVLRLTLLRTLLHVLGVGAMFSALRFLPVADAVAIVFVMPFILLLLARLVLGEDVGPRRLMACVVGFAGTLLVIQPSFAEVGPPALLPLLVALFFALFILVTRQVAKEVDPVTLQAVSGVFAALGLAPLLLVAGGEGSPVLGWVGPDARELWLLGAIGLVGTSVHLLMTWSLRFAPSATLAPMQYLEIPFAALFGWLIFRDLPNGMAAFGIVVTVAAGLYVIYRERVRAQSAG
jgi:drug/metabolite transporter (DMT)-like permease